MCRCMCMYVCMCTYRDPSLRRGRSIQSCSAAPPGPTQHIERHVRDPHPRTPPSPHTQSLCLASGTHSQDNPIKPFNTRTHAPSLSRRQTLCRSHTITPNIKETDTRAGRNRHMSAWRAGRQTAHSLLRSNRRHTVSQATSEEPPATHMSV